MQVVHNAVQQKVDRTNNLVQFIITSEETSYALSSGETAVSAQSLADPSI